MLRTEDIYEEILRDHIFHSRNYMQPVKRHTHRSLGTNLACGDEMTVYINMLGNTIQEISFNGNCCSVSKASASLMTEEIKGKSSIEALEKFSNIEQLLATSGKYESGIFEQLIAHLFEISIRKQQKNTACVLLPWKTMIKAIQTAKSVN